MPESRHRLVTVAGQVMLWAMLAWPAAPATVPRGAARRQAGGVIRGRLSMEDRTVLQHCRVVLTNSATRARRYAFANSSGDFRFDQVAPGSYVVSACAGMRINFRTKTVRIERDGDLRTIHFVGGAEASGRPAPSRQRSCLAVTAANPLLYAKPGGTAQTLVSIQNNCRRAEVYELRVDAPGATAAVMREDKNFDGRLQDSEPAVSRTKLLNPHGDRQQFFLRIDFPDSLMPAQELSYILSVWNIRTKKRGRVAARVDITALTTQP